jgi:TonB family protein
MQATRIIVLAVTLLAVQPPVQQGVHGLAGAGGSPTAGEQAELCGRPVAVSCKGGAASIMMDVGVEQTLPIRIPASAVPFLLKDFESQYLRREVCATGTYRGSGITVSDLTTFSVRGEADVVVPPFTTSAASECDSGVTPPTLIAQTKPQYTRAAMQQKIEGVVLIEAIIDVDGTVTEARVLRSLDPEFGLDDEALKAAKQWRFAPSTRGGVPLPLRVTIQLKFALR